VQAAVAEVGEFGVDAADPGVGPAVLGVPLLAVVDLGAHLVDVSLTSSDFRFGALNVVGEAADLVEDCRFLVAAVAAELGEGAEFAAALLGRFEPVVGPVEVLLG
jgi:hypothetical protein